MSYINSLLGLIDKGDHAFVGAIAEVRNDFFIKVFLTITDLGGIYSILLLSVIMLVAMIFWKKRYDLVFPFIATLIGSIGTSALLKILIERARPSVLLNTVIETGFSMPSIHATGAMALYGFFVYFSFKRSHNTLHKIGFMLFGLIIVSLIGYSRIYIGAHYPSDVLVGFVVGFLWLFIGVHVWHKSDKPSEIAPH